MEEKRFTLRMNGKLFEQISKKAEENHRSVAKEIEFAISQYLSAPATERLWGYALSQMSDSDITKFIDNVRNDDNYKNAPMSQTIMEYLERHK